MATKIMLNDIPESKIRIAIWELSKGMTKKHVCSTLGITYNTKKLDSIIEEFNAKNTRLEELKKQARSKKLTDLEKNYIVKEYNSGVAISKLAEDRFLTPQRIKAVLTELNVPLRGRGKHSEAKVEHIKQDLDIKLAKNDRVFVATENVYAKIIDVYDEEYLENLRNGKQKYIKLSCFDDMVKKDPSFETDEDKHRIGVHYEIYWQLESNPEAQWKLNSLMQHIKEIETVLEYTGRELYKVWHEGEFNKFAFYKRAELIPINKEI